MTMKEPPISPETLPSVAVNRSSQAQSVIYA